MFKQIFISGVSACFELDGGEVYYSSQSYDVYLNDKKIIENKTENVFSLFNLLPSTEYAVKVVKGKSSHTQNITTKAETGAISVKDFFAKGDGVTDDTLALQAAISRTPRRGRLVVDKGVYLTAPLTLKSHITLELKKGAVILAVFDKSKYAVIPGEINGVQCASWEGNPAACYAPVISAAYARDICIVGEGVIDGNGDKGWYADDVKKHTVFRPKLMFFNACEDVTMHGIKTTNPAVWAVHPFFCKNVSLLDCYVEAHKDSPNTDGFDPESCDGVNVIGTVFSTGDDCIAVKSGKIYMGQKYNTPCSNIVIRNCKMMYGHGSVVLGSELSGGIKNITVTKCLFINNDRGLRIKTRRGRGKNAVIENVTFKNIKMQGVLTPFTVNMFYFCDPDGKSDYVQNKNPLPVDDRTPYIGEFLFEDIVCDDCQCACGFFYGLPEAPIEGIKFKNVSFKMKKDAKESMPAMLSDVEKCRKKGIIAKNVKELKLENVTFDGIEGEQIVK